MADLERDRVYTDDTTVEPTDADMDSRAGDGEHHATTGGSAVAGAVTGGLVGLAGGPVGAVAGAVGGAIVGAAAERVMHTDDDREGEAMGLDSDRDGNMAIESREKETPRGAYDAGDTRMAAGTMDRPGTMDRSGSTVQVREEQLIPRKEMVQTGEVEVRKEVHTEHKTIDVPVTREEVVIDRHPVDSRPATDASFREEGQTVRVPVMEERVEVEKRPVVTEEISVGKRIEQDTQPVSAELRREEAHVERNDAEVRDTTTGTRPMGSTMPGHQHSWVENSCSCGATR